jgi:hypothetical protein
LKPDAAVRSYQGLEAALSGDLKGATQRIVAAASLQRGRSRRGNRAILPSWDFSLHANAKTQARDAVSMLTAAGATTHADSTFSAGFHGSTKCRCWRARPMQAKSR